MLTSLSDTTVRLRKLAHPLGKAIVWLLVALFGAVVVGFGQELGKGAATELLDYFLVEKSSAPGGHPPGPGQDEVCGSFSALQPLNFRVVATGPEQLEDPSLWTF